MEFVRQLVARGEDVVGTCRDPASAIELGKLAGFVVALDVSDQAAAVAAASMVAERLGAVDLLINAAGVEDSVASAGPVGGLESEALVEIYRTNAVGPALVTQAFTELLKRSDRALVLNLTSQRGSLEGAVTLGHIGYAMSKAALNMVTRKLALELQPNGTTVVAISPGWVKTDMGGADAPLTPSESVQAMLALADRLTLSDTGAVLDHDQVRSAAAPAG